MFLRLFVQNKQSQIFVKRTKIGTKYTCGVEAWKRYVFVPIHIRKKKGFAQCELFFLLVCVYMLCSIYK